MFWNFQSWTQNRELIVSYRNIIDENDPVVPYLSSCFLQNVEKRKNYWKIMRINNKFMN